MKAKRPAKRRRSLCFFYIAGLLIPVALLLALASALLGDASGESPAPSTLSDNPASPAPSLGTAGEWEEEAPWQLRLVNSTHPLPEDWAPDLTVLDPYTGEEFDSRAIGYLNEMLSAMESEGLHPLVCSGYRSYESQVRIFQDNVEDAITQGFSQEEAEQQASLWVMPPAAASTSRAWPRTLCPKKTSGWTIPRRTPPSSNGSTPIARITALSSAIPRTRRT